MMKLARCLAVGSLAFAALGEELDDDSYISLLQTRAQVIDSEEHVGLTKLSVGDLKLRAFHDGAAVGTIIQGHISKDQLIDIIEHAEGTVGEHKLHADDFDEGEAAHPHEPKETEGPTTLIAAEAPIAAEGVQKIHPANLARVAHKAHKLEMHRQQAQEARNNKFGAKAKSTVTGAVRLLDFTKAETIYNNLGGQGPIKTLSDGSAAPEEIRYRNLVSGTSVDLVITAAAGYKAYNPSRNSIQEGNGQINAKSGTSVDMTFSFVEENTMTPHVMPIFYITFSDIDERHGGAEAERITVDGYETYYTNDDLSIVADASPLPTFQSSDYGNYSDNIFEADSPSPQQLSHAVTYKFLEKSSFRALFKIQELADADAGRNVLFSGISQLVFCQEQSTYLNFATSTVTVNNLGGNGPATEVAHQIRWSNIGTSTGTGQALDLVAYANESYGYKAWNASSNGRNGDFGIINLFSGPTQANSEAYITFKVVESGTETLVTLNQFAFVVFDFDSGLHEQEVEYVEMKPNPPGFQGGNGYASYIVSENTEVAVSNSDDADGGDVKFSATKHGTGADNPTSAQSMARETTDKSVVFTFRNTAQFKITLGITPTGADTGRNFMFSGQDMYTMCD